MRITTKSFENIDKKKIRLYIFLKYLTYFLVMLTLARANIDSLRPFAWGLYVALVFFGQNALVVSLLYFAACAIIEPTINSLISAVCIVLVMLIVLHSTKNKSR